jgi:hypothetical protein
MSHVKEDLEQALIDKLHADAKKQGYTCAAIGASGYANIHRMTKVQLQDELDRLNGVKKMEDLPANHVCIVVG